MDFKGFVRQCYLRSEPSVDLETTQEQVNCSDHKLSMSEYDKILEEFGVKQGSDEMMSCNMWMLMSGPQLVEDKR